MKYVWRCTSCGNEVDVERTFAEYTNPPEECPKCNGNVWERLIGATSFILKGQGWYAKGGY